MILRAYSGEGKPFRKALFHVAVELWREGAMANGAHIHLFLSDRDAREFPFEIPAGSLTRQVRDPVVVCPVMHLEVGVARLLVDEKVRSGLAVLTCGRFQAQIQNLAQPAPGELGSLEEVDPSLRPGTIVYEIRPDGVKTRASSSLLPGALSGNAKRAGVRDDSRTKGERGLEVAARGFLSLYDSNPRLAADLAKISIEAALREIEEERS